MKKIWLLVMLCLLAACAPALAASGDEACWGQDAECAEGSGTFRGAISYVNSHGGGYVRLRKNVVVDQTLNIAETMTLDLRSFTIQTTDTKFPFYINGYFGASFTLTDTSAAQSGVIFGMNNEDAAVFFLYNGASFTMDSGIIMAQKGKAIKASSDRRAESITITKKDGHAPLLHSLNDEGTIWLYGEGSSLLIEGGTVCNYGPYKWAAYNSSRLAAVSVSASAHTDRIGPSDAPPRFSPPRFTKARKRRRPCSSSLPTISR